MKNIATKLIGLPSSKLPVVAPVLHSCVCTHRIVSYICQFEPKNTKAKLRNSATSFTVLNTPTVLTEQTTHSNRDLGLFF